LEVDLNLLQASHYPASLFHLLVIELEDDVLTRRRGCTVFVNAGSTFELNLIGRHIAIAVGYASGIGLFFGYYPARRASLLRPVECLRQD
jgi:ABC-type lipoprotein release transport system permease subunit